jgi:hypothetical protein
MLLNEFLKEHRKVQELEKAMAALTTQFKEQAAQIQKVNAHLERSEGGPQTVATISKRFVEHLPWRPVKQRKEQNQIKTQLLGYLRRRLGRLFRRAYNRDTPGAVADFDATQFFARFYVHN